MFRQSFDQHLMQDETEGLKNKILELTSVVTQIQILDNAFTVKQDSSLLQMLKTGYKCYKLFRGS